MPDLAIATEVNPSAGIDTISKYIGLQRQQTGLAQQKQALQTGAFEQQTAQATSEQAQQRNRELQAVGNLISTAHQTKRYDNPDGGFNRQLFSDDVAQVAPTYGQEISGRAMSTANEIVSNRQAHKNLSSSFQAQQGAGFAALQTKDDLSPTDIVNELDRQTDINRDPEFKRMALSMAAHLPPPPPLNAPPEAQQAYRQTLKDTMQRWSIAATAPEAAAATTMPQNITSAAGVPINRKPTSGALSAPAQVGPGAGGLTPPSPVVAGQTVRQTGTGNADVDRSNEVGGLQQQSSAAIPLTLRIDQLSRDINSGRVAKAISETGNYFGIASMNEARSQLNKDLGQVKGLAIARAGSDSRAATILEGYPTDTTPESTIHAAMDYLRGTARQNLARGQLLTQYQKNDPQGVRGFQAADNVLTGTTDPLMHEYMALKPEEVSGFYKRNFSTPQEAQEFKNRVAATKRHISLQ